MLRAETTHGHIQACLEESSRREPSVPSACYRGLFGSSQRCLDLWGVTHGKVTAAPRRGGGRVFGAFAGGHPSRRTTQSAGLPHGCAGSTLELLAGEKRLDEASDVRTRAELRLVMLEGGVRCSQGPGASGNYGQHTVPRKAGLAGKESDRQENGRVSGTQEEAAVTCHGGNARLQSRDRDASLCPGGNGSSSGLRLHHFYVRRCPTSFWSRPLSVLVHQLCYIKPHGPGGARGLSR